MPAYDFRCKQCDTAFSTFYKSISAYAQATPTCPECGSSDLNRIIDSVGVQAPTRDFTRMNAQEMLSVLESGDSKQVNQMYDQVGGTNPALGLDAHKQTQQLRDQQAQKAPKKSASDDD